jgi:hypothetical protein
MKTVKKVSVTMRALTQRINRKLAQQDEQLKKSGSVNLAQDLGDYYVLDLQRNAVARLNVDPEELGRKLGVLRAWECVAE